MSSPPASWTRGALAAPSGHLQGRAARRRRLARAFTPSSRCGSWEAVATEVTAWTRRAVVPLLGPSGGDGDSRDAVESGRTRDGARQARTGPQHAGGSGDSGASMAQLNDALVPRASSDLDLRFHYGTILDAATAEDAATVSLVMQSTRLQVLVLHQDGDVFTLPAATNAEQSAAASSLRALLLCPEAIDTTDAPPGNASGVLSFLRQGAPRDDTARSRVLFCDLQSLREARKRGSPVLDHIAAVLQDPGVEKVTPDGDALRMVAHAVLGVQAENVTSLARVAAALESKLASHIAIPARTRHVGLLQAVWHIVAGVGGPAEGNDRRWALLAKRVDVLKRASAAAKRKQDSAVVASAAAQCANLTTALRALTATHEAAGVAAPAPAAGVRGVRAALAWALRTSEDGMGLLDLEELSFAEDGRAVRKAGDPLASLTSARPRSRLVAQRERDAQDMELLMLLQVLPSGAREWIARRLGHGSVHAMLERLGVRPSPAPAAPQRGHARAVSRLGGAGTAGAAVLSSLASWAALGSSEHAPQSDVTTSRRPCAPAGAHGDAGADAGAEGAAVTAQDARNTLVEVLIDDGRDTLLRFEDRSEEALPVAVPSSTVLEALVVLANIDVDPTMAAQPFPLLDAGAQRRDTTEAQRTRLPAWPIYAHDVFHASNRIGISGTLHRISAIEDHRGAVSGLTLRVGRHIPSASWPLTDILTKIAAAQRHHAESATALGGRPSPLSLLVLGAPGTGKTTLLRDISYYLSTELRLGRRLIVVDSSAEIGGQGRVPHPAIGAARRMVVPRDKRQADVLSQAVTNHNPAVIMVDEISKRAEVDAVQSISKRGVALVATAHGVDLASLIGDPDLGSLVGGVHEVVLSDRALHDGRRGLRPHAVRRPFSRHANAKTRQERRRPPVFQCVVEILRRDAWRVHQDTAASVDALLAGETPPCEVRMLNNGQVFVADEPRRGARG